MNYEGKVLQLLPVETINIGWNDRQKQTIVLEENRDSEYKWGIAVDFWGDKLNLLADVSVWDVVIVSMNSRARENNWRWYNSITWWKVERAWDGPAVPPSSGAPVAAATPVTTATEKVTPAPASKELEDELPF